MRQDQQGRPEVGEVRERLVLWQVNQRNYILRDWDVVFTMTGQPLVFSAT